MRRSRHRRSGRRGSSIVEVLAAVTVFAVGSLAAASMQRTAAVVSQQASTRQAATALAQRLVETARGLSYTDSRLDDVASFTAPDTTLSPSNPLDADGNAASSGFTRTWRITSASPIANVKTIEVKVAWAGRGLAREVTLATIKAR